MSCFDPVRREIARLALEKLIADGRIHPTRIEEMVEKARNVKWMPPSKRKASVPSLKLACAGLHPELVKLLGRLRLPYQLRPECAEPLH